MNVVMTKMDESSYFYCFPYLIFLCKTVKKNIVNYSKKVYMFYIVTLKVSKFLIELVSRIFCPSDHSINSFS